MQLKKWRNLNRIPMQALAEMLGLKSGASILHYENGKIPKPATIKKIEKVTKGKVKLKDFDVLVKEYLGLVVLGILENANEDEPVGERELIEKIQSECLVAIDPEAILTSLADLERKGIINGRKGYFPENERFFYFENVNAINEKGIYGAFLAKLGARKKRMEVLAESIGVSRK